MILFFSVIVTSKKERVIICHYFGKNLLFYLFGGCCKKNYKLNGVELKQPRSKLIGDPSFFAVGILRF